MAIVVADVFDVVLIDSEGEVFGTTTLQDAGLEFKVQESDVRAGKGNQLQGILHSDRDIAINLNDISFRYDWIAKQLGQSITTGAGVAYAMPTWYEVIGSTPTITLASTPVDGNDLVIFDSSNVKITTYTLAGSTVTFTSGAVAGDNVLVKTYTYATSASTETIEIDNSVFAKGVKAILETIEIETTTEAKTATLQWQFTNALPSGNFTVNTKSAKEASVQSFNLRVVKPTTSTVVGKSLRIPVA